MASVYIPKDRTRREHVGMLDKVLWADDDAPKVILRLTDGASVIGPAPTDQFVRGQLYRFYGTWKDGRRGCDFHFLTVIRDTPMTRGAVVHYLASTCRNVGKVTAERLFDKFGSDAVATLRREPRTVADTGLMALDAAEEAARDLEVYAGAERTRVELHGMFAGRGFPGHLIDACIGSWGVRAPELIRRNPFALLVRRMPGCSFKRVDKLYLETGGRPGALKRQAMCAVNIIKRDHSGSTWLDADAVAADVTRAVPGADPWRALILLRRGQWVRVRRLDGKRFVALRERADAEMRIADNVRRLSRFPAAWPTEIPASAAEGDGLPTAHQVAELKKATAGAVGCFVGGPGTGKTYALSFLLKAFIAEHGPDAVAVAAPTGKAAVRAGESLRARGLEVVARTQHQLLEIGRNGHDGDGWGFERNRDNPLDVTALVIDESSMDDASLLADTLDAVPDGGCVLFVGDEWQLPPVGHGAPLRDLLAGGVPQGKLTEIHRNAGSIVEACAAIKAGTPVRFDERFDLAAPCPRNLRIIDCPAAEALDVLADVVGQMSRFDPIWETQIITPLNGGEKSASAVSRARVNGRFGPVFNPDGKGAPGNPFRVGDKVICTTNTRLKCVVPLADRYGHPDMALDAANYQTVAGDRRGNEAEWYVANGEVGRVVAVSRDATVARFGGVNVPLVRFSHTRVRESDDEDKKAAAAGAGGDFDHAWGITAHRCVHPDTLVETEDGLLPIKLVAGDGFIATPDGGKVYTNKVVNPVGPALRVTTKHGYTVTVTPDHRVERWTGDDYSMCFAGQLRQGDWLRVRLGTTVEPTRPAMLPVLQECDPRATRFRTPQSVDADVAEFFGLMVADGTVFDHGFRLLKRHRDVAERFGELCRTLFGCSTHPVKLNGATGFEVRSTYLADWLRLVGGMSPNAKAVPESVLRSDSVMHAAFLRGLFEDGTVNIDSDGLCDHIEWGTVHPALLDTVQVMLLRLGVISTANRTGTTKRYKPLYIYGRSAAQFGRAVGFVSEFKRRRLVACRETETKFTLPVSRVQADGLRAACSQRTVQNARTRGTVSRETARAAGWHERLDWFEDPIVSIEPVQCESMCVEVPDGHRFLQNGFPWWNSQGSEWPCVICMVDPEASSICDMNYWYTAISRARSACLLIGPKGAFEKQVKRVALTRRRTFLGELLREGL